jgi:hypothetical protein
MNRGIVEQGGEQRDACILAECILLYKSVAKSWAPHNRKTLSCGARRVVLFLSFPLASSLTVFRTKISPASSPFTPCLDRMRPVKSYSYLVSSMFSPVDLLPSSQTLRLQKASDLLVLPAVRIAAVSAPGGCVRIPDRREPSPRANREDARVNRRS